jgi:hypothetical protein
VQMPEKMFCRLIKGSVCIHRKRTKTQNGPASTPASAASRLRRKV